MKSVLDAPPSRAVLFTGRCGGSEMRLVRVTTAEREQFERELMQRGTALPFAARAATASLPEYEETHVLALLDETDTCAALFAVQSRPAPLIPGHSLYRIEHFSAGLPPHLDELAVTALSDWVRRQRNVLRFSVDVFSFDAQRRDTLGALFAAEGYHRAEHVNGYVDTVVTDLMPNERDIFAGLHHSARRKIRQGEKPGVAVQPVTDVSFAARMNSLMQETMARTGGTFHERDWARRIEVSNAAHESSRIMGFFRTDTAGPASLLAFAWGCHCGDFAFYSEAASTRDTGDLRLPLAYAVMWELMVWAKQSGARCFDLGGITEGAHGGDDPLGGISDFKRYFSQRVVTVRDEWILDSHSWRASLAARLHRHAQKR